MSSMHLSADHMTPPGPLSIPSPMSSQTGGTSDGSDSASYVQNYMPLFPGQVESSDPAVSSVSPSLSHDPLAQCLRGQETLVPSPLDNSSGMDAGVASVITHTASSTDTSSDVAATFNHSSQYRSMSAQPQPEPSQLQPLPSPGTPVQHPQTFALPRPVQSSSANKNRPVQRIAPAISIPSSQIILTGKLIYPR